MISLAFLITLLGFISCYHSSKRAKFNVKYPVQQWLKNHPKNANYLGILLMVLGLCICFLHLGWLVGSLYFLMILSLAASLSILLIPLKIPSLKLWGVLIALILLTEIYLSYYAGK
ncbi:MULTISPECIES: DUF3325 family protein [Salegentibacter]|uniref:DUF3325 family protein n=1 Tax=Salegentibacter TaxID=143222 RepID=UPI00187B5884|nr:DUF3325 family protein [Salegentibacter sp. BLCTC]MBE7641381.1 hypothetical protein [Salegentibacter sp. BLCTC]